jgi:hypothetical protein
MRSILVAGLVLMLAVPAAQAQQFVPPVEVEPVQSSLIEAPPHWSQADSASVQPVEAYSRTETAAAADAMREPSARTLLAVVGAVVVVVALIALVR